MVTRPVLYHPYRPSTPRRSPAGFRITDYINPRRCFDFINIRFPAPSPLNSPHKSPHHPEDDAPPTKRLAGLFDNDFGSPQRPPTPDAHDHQNAIPEANVPTQDPSSMPPRHRPRHLSFSSNTNCSGALPPHRRAQRMREKRDNARKRVLDRHERRLSRARESFSKLRKGAEAFMKPQRMNAEDKIFLEQLDRLDFEQALDYDLERCRQRMVRAAAEAPERRQEHAERDTEAAKLWGECQDEEALEEQQRRVAEFVKVCKDQEAAHFQRMEEEAMRMDEQRQRAHEARERQVREVQERIFRQELARKAKETEERQAREEQDRLFRQELARKVREAEERRKREEQERLFREELARKFKEAEERQKREERERRLREERERQLREEMERRRQLEELRKLREELEKLRGERERYRREERERFAREERERYAREERERFAREERERYARREARFADEQARRPGAHREEIRQQFATYEAKWNELRTNASLPPIDVREMPWPVFGVVFSAEHLTHQDVREFLFHPQRPGVEGKTARDKVRAEMLRFHPDKFNTRILPKIQPSHQAVAQAIAGAVVRILTSIMTEVE